MRYCSIGQDGEGKSCCVSDDSRSLFPACDVRMSGSFMTFSPHSCSPEGWPTVHSCPLMRPGADIFMYDHSQQGVISIFI